MSTVETRVDEPFERVDARCLRCGVEMRPGVLGERLYVSPGQSVWKALGRRSAVDVRVCPNCGRIELMARDLRKFRT